VENEGQKGVALPSQVTRDCQTSASLKLFQHSFVNRDIVFTH
jgi:hypothetical protein